MKKNISFLYHTLLKTLVILILVSSVESVPIANSSSLNYGFVTNVSDSAEQIKHEMEWDKKSTDVAEEELQVLGQTVDDETERLLSSSTNVTEVSPATEILVPGQLNKGQVEVKDVTPVSKELESGGGAEDSEVTEVRRRLQKLDFYFEFLRVMSEDCRQRLLCEVTRDAERFYPLSTVFEEATSFAGSHRHLTSQLVNTTEGARLLSYLEAAFSRQERGRTCAVFQYRCPSRTEEMINYNALCLWREMVHWLTVHVVAKVH